MKLEKLTFVGSKILVGMSKQQNLALWIIDDKPINTICTNYPNLIVEGNEEFQFAFNSQDDWRYFNLRKKY